MQMTQTNSFGSDPSISFAARFDKRIYRAAYRIDGLPYNGYWNDINPADIQNIAVLKDAASALYGARGANGVILLLPRARAAWRNESQHHGKVGCEHRRPHTV